MNKRLLCGVAACLLTVSLLGGCGGAETEDAGATTTTAAPTTTTTAAPEPTEAPKDPATYNRLTGLYDSTVGKEARAIGVMIGNNDRSRPQTGLANADMFVEAETEGGITRIMAIFSDPSRVPSQLCPIRSCRSPFVLMAEALDIVYVHAGGSKAGLQTLKNSGIASINALSAGGDTFWRDAQLRSSRGMEYSLSTSGAKLSSWIAAKGIRSTSDRTPFTFADTVSGDTCTELQVVHSGSQTNCFVYNTERGLYKKYVGKLGSASVHVTTDNAAIEVSNVLVMYDSKYAENETTINFNLKSGKGILCAGGKVRQINWTRTADGLNVTTEDGKPATFLTGKTYICLVNQANQKSTIIR